MKYVKIKDQVLMERKLYNIEKKLMLMIKGEMEQKYNFWKL